jgi:mRNA interferase MazF
MPLPLIQRGEIWVDLGYLGKIRPVLVASVPLLDTDRTLVVIVPHITSIAGTRFEIAIPHPALQRGAFDVQQIAAVPAVKFLRRLGILSTQQSKAIDEGIAPLPGLTLAK